MADQTPKKRTFKGRRDAATHPDREEINADRPPSSRVAEYAMCGARLKKDGKFTGDTCTQKAGFGTDHPGYGGCKFHAGLTAAGKKAAARQAGREIIKEVKFGGDLKITNVTAEQALIEEVQRSTAMVRWLEERIGTWKVGEYTDDLGGLPRLGTVTFKGNPAPTEEAAWLLLYREERAHAAKVAKMCIDAGIAERMVRVAEEQGVMLAQAIRAVLEALNLTPKQARMVPQVVPAILRSLTTPAIEGKAS